MKTWRKKRRRLTMWRALSILILVFALVACKAKQPTVTNAEIVSEKTIEKDRLTPVAVPGEKSLLKALFECDSLNRVMLVNFSELKSKNMQSDFSFANGQLEYAAETQPDTVFIKSTDRWYYINKHIKKTITITREVPVEVNKWGLLDWVGLLAIIAIIALLVLNSLILPLKRF